MSNNYIKTSFKSKKSILFLVNVDWFFLSHRLPVARAAKKNGYTVYVAAADTGYGRKIESNGFNFIDIPFTRKGTNIFKELLMLPRLLYLFFKIKPDIIHNVSIKPVLFGSLIARLFINVKVVNAITGLGFVFSKDAKATTIKRLVTSVYRLSLQNPRQRTIFQNIEDRNVFLEKGFTKYENTLLIKGSGVDCSIFKPGLPLSNDTKHIVLLASRMIWDKGISEFVEAAQIVKNEFPTVRFVLAGLVDEGNPNMVPLSMLKEWNKLGIIEWWGNCDNMVDILQKATIVTLPTYYPEGVPKILIEAAATGKPLITTDRPGCNDIVRDCDNGILIPEKNCDALANAIILLLKNPNLRDLYGNNGRKLVLKEFSEEIVIEKTLEVYAALLNS